MEVFNRFSIQILGTVDSNSTEELLKLINDSLGRIPKFKIKAVSHDMWVNGYTGEPRFFDKNGKEVSDQPVLKETQILEI